MGGTGKKEVDLESLQSVLDTITLASKIDLNEVTKRIEAEQTPNDRMIEALKSNRKIRRGVKKNTVKFKKQHWKTTASKRRGWYEKVGGPRRKEKVAELLTTGEGWYSYLTAGWHRHKQEYKLTQEEFLEHIFPRMTTDGTATGRVRNVPVFHRYSTKKPLSLDNSHIVDMDSGSTIFDGAEYKLRRLGYIL